MTTKERLMKRIDELDELISKKHDHMVKVKLENIDLKERIRELEHKLDGYDGRVRMDGTVKLAPHQHPADGG